MRIRKTIITICSVISIVVAAFFAAGVFGLKIVPAVKAACPYGSWQYCVFEGQPGCQLCYDGVSWGVCAWQDYPAHCSAPAPTATPTTAPTATPTSGPTPTPTTAPTPTPTPAPGGGGVYVGVVTYGTAYDLDADPGSQGSTLVSGTNWLVNEAYPSIDYYQVFFHRLGAPITPNYDQLAQGGAQPATSGTYYVVGDLTTSGNWSVGAGESIIFLVNGNLTLGGKINITSGGFIAFIVNGNISVASNVGGLYSSSLPVVEGIYVTSPTGTFYTGTSSVVAAERFVGKGMFVAGNFLLQRDLDAIGQNQTTSAELFIYNPQLLFTMPDIMKDVPITWQEVAP